MAEPTARRGDPQRWIAAGLDALAEGGLAAVRVEALARRLKVTKGSFYWHFADRPALLKAIADRWRDGRVVAIRDQAGADSLAPRARLGRLLDLYHGNANPRGLRIELAMRDWARRDPNAARAVQAVDEARLEVVAGLYRAGGVEAKAARARAVLFYAFVFGRSLIPAGDGQDGLLRELVLGQKN